MTYRADIDGLRSVAILLVTIFHFDLFSSGKAGFIGVDVFFVISGYLITTIIVKQLGEGRFAMGNFLYRRIHRLAPALFATLILYLIAGYFLLLPDMFEELAFEALLSQLYVINFYFWQNVYYFGLQASAVPLLHMWSLALEEQFYLLFPVFCVVIHKWRPKQLLLACVLLAMVSFLLALNLEPSRPEAAFYLLPTRAWELLIGSILAIACLRHPPSAWWLGFAGGAGAALIAIGIALYTPASAVPGWLITLPVFGTALLLLAGHDKHALTTRVLSCKPLVWIGLISYPAYLVHWPVLVLIRENTFEFTLAWKLLGFFLSFFLAWLVYVAVERPIRSYRFLKTKARFGWAAGATTAALILATAGIIMQNGVPQRFSPEVNAALAYQSDEALAFRECTDRLGPNGPPCVLGDPSATPDMLVIGDSHANAYAKAIDMWLEREGRAAVFSFRFGCLPVRNMGKPHCEEQVEQAIALTKERPTVDTVMLISIWRQPYESGVLWGGKWRTGSEAADAFDVALLETVSAFAEEDVQTVLVEPFFSTPQSVSRTVAKNKAFGTEWPTGKPLSDHQTTFARLFHAFDLASFFGTKRISLIDGFCENELCSGLFEKRPIFTDDNHVAGWMSEHLSKVFEAEMRSLGGTKPSPSGEG